MSLNSGALSWTTVHLSPHITYMQDPTNSTWSIAVSDETRQLSPKKAAGLETPNAPSKMKTEQGMVVDGPFTGEAIDAHKEREAIDYERMRVAVGVVLYVAVGWLLLALS